LANCSKSNAPVPPIFATSTISLIAGRPGEPSQTEFGQDMIGVVPCGR
jgi:hypothetical protein